MTRLIQSFRPNSFAAISLLAGLLFGVLADQTDAQTLAEAKKTFGKELAAAEKAEKDFWKEIYSDKKRKAHETYEAEWQANWGLPNGAKEVHYDFKGYRALSDEYQDIVRRRAGAFAGLGGHGAEGMEILYKYYGHFITEAQDIEKKLRKERPVQSFNIFDQRLGMELAGHDRTLGVIVTAMAATRGEDAAAYLVEEYSKAEKADRKVRDIRMRDGILRTLAVIAPDQARQLAAKGLADPNVAMRVVAVEAICKLEDSDSARDVVIGHLRNESTLPVVRTALDVWRSGRWTSSKAVPALIELFENECATREGALRLDYMDALIALTGIDMGLTPANWAGWMANNEAAIKDGTYKKPEPEKPATEGEGEESGDKPEGGEPEGDKPEEGEPEGEKPEGEGEKPAGEGEKPEGEGEEPAGEGEKPAGEGEATETGETSASDTAKKRADEIAEGATVSFFDLKSLSKSVVFLVDASDTLMLPAEIEVAKTKAYWEWRTGNKKQIEGIKTQLDRLIEECEKTLSSLHPTCKFNVVLMMDDYRKSRFQPGMVEATDANKKKAIAFLKAARPNGWASQLSGLMDAMEMGGAPTDTNEFTTFDVDTVFLLSDGVPCGGWWMDAREVVRAFERYNRFRRLTVHSIRIANEPATDAELLMKGIADSSGGSYIWLKK